MSNFIAEMQILKRKNNQLEAENTKLKNCLDAQIEINKLLAAENAKQEKQLLESEAQNYCKTCGKVLEGYKSPQKMFDDEREAFIWGFAFGTDYGYEGVVKKSFGTVDHGHLILAGVSYDGLLSKEEDNE